MKNILWLCVFLFSCIENQNMARKSGGGYANVTPSPSPPFDYPVMSGPRITYLANIAPIIQNSCTSCHSSSMPQGNVNLSTYVNDRSLWSRVVNEVSAKRMPKSQGGMQTPLSSEQINMFLQWQTGDFLYQ